MSTHKRQAVLLLTATIKPRPGQPSLVLTNPEARFEEYASALDFYSRLLARHEIDGIVFAENSGADLSALANRFPSRAIEWLSVPGLDYPIDYHRGYGEFKLIDAAMANSRLIAAAGADVVVWKVSGRYIVKNLSSIVRWASRRLDIYTAVERGWAEMSVMAWSLEGHAAVLKNVWEHFAMATPPEFILAERLSSLRNAELRIVTKSCRPFVTGRRGSDGSDFQGPHARVKFWLATAERVLSHPLRRLRQS